MKHELINIDNIIYKGQNCFIPVSKREEMLNIVNEPHIETVKRKERTKQFVCLEQE